MKNDNEVILECTASSLGLAVLDFANEMIVEEGVSKEKVEMFLGLISYYAKTYHEGEIFSDSPDVAKFMSHLEDKLNTLDDHIVHREQCGKWD